MMTVPLFLALFLIAMNIVESDKLADRALDLFEEFKLKFSKMYFKIFISNKLI
jgi:hypothetical protein